MIKKRSWLPAALVTVAAASLAAVMFTSYAFAQCSACMDPKKDPFTQGLATTPANPPGAATTRNPYNSRAEMQPYRSRHSRNTARRHR